MIPIEIHMQKNVIYVFLWKCLDFVRYMGPCNMKLLCSLFLNMDKRFDSHDAAQDIARPWLRGTCIVNMPWYTACMNRKICPGMKAIVCDEVVHNFLKMLRSVVSLCKNEYLLDL